MHTIKIEFEAVEKEVFEQVKELVISLSGAWRMNGQTLGKQTLFAENESRLEVYVNAPNSDSLSERYNNKYVTESLEKLNTLNLILKFTVLGKEPESADLCECKRIKGYILFTTYASLESPLRCLVCFGGIPLYTIPKTYDEEYYNIISWQSDYQSCDSLQMNCTVGERFATNQLSKYDSQLTKQGLKACRSIEEVTGKKVYYYLYKYGGKSFKTELARKCPNCKNSWHLKKPLHKLFDFKCDKCQLLSNIAFDLR